jgi:hypothetical protein
MPAEGPPRTVKLAGWALLVTWLAIVTAAFVKYGSCDVNVACDDSRRAAGMGVLLASPLAAVGAMLLTVGGSGWAVRLLWWAAAAAGALLGVIAIGLLLHAAGRFLALWSGRPLGGNLSDLDAARASARTEGIVSAIAGVVVGGLAAGGFLPLLGGSRSLLARRLSSGVLVLLLMLCAGIGVIGVATSPAKPITLAVALVGLAGISGAVYALTRAWTLDPGPAG